MQTMNLPCRLTEEELQTRGNELAAAVADIARLEDARKSIAKEAKEEVDEAKLHAMKLATIVATKKEDRPVEVIVSPSLKERLMLTVRTDTAEVVESRAMTLAEFEDLEQTRFSFAERSRSEAAKAEAEIEAIGKEHGIEPKTGLRTKTA